jgi:hypothetical protein
MPACRSAESGQSTGELTRNSSVAGLRSNEIRQSDRLQQFVNSAIYGDNFE